MPYEVIKSEDKLLWNEKLRDYPHTSYHTWEYCNALSYSIEERILLFVGHVANQKLVCTFAVREKLVGYSDIFTPYGYGGLYTESKGESHKLRDLWISFLLKFEFTTSYLMLHPCVTFDASWAKVLFNHTNVYLLDLARSTDDLWKNLGKGHKSEIKKFQNNSSVTIVSDKVQIKKAFASIYRETMLRVQASKTYDFTEETLDLFVDSESSLILGATVNGEIKTLVLFLIGGGIAEYFISASSDMENNCTKLLIWEAVKILQSKGVLKLHLGGGVKTGDALDDFKRRFGAIQLPLHVNKEIIDTSKYNHLCKTFEIDKKHSEDYFPPYWKS